SGINKRKLEALGCKYKCFVSDEEVAKLAKEKGITRSMAAVEVASREEGKKIFVLGNAPTALYKVIEMSNNGQLAVEAVVGVPVGFVGAEESKDELAKTDIPYIISKGRKGGSNLAAAIINAILYSL
ncbi:MAG: precorrin-8X methylmutase, partial [Staphylococcus warneri]|nr:precorrin-8X methylmutase [Staphylococcus warneri]